MSSLLCSAISGKNDATFRLQSLEQSLAQATFKTHLILTARYKTIVRTNHMTHIMGLYMIKA